MFKLNYIWIISLLGKEEESRSVGVVPKPAAATQQQPKRKDDAYDQFMKEMENLL